MNTASGSETRTTTLEYPLSIVTEIGSEHEAEYRYLTDDTGEYFVAIKDVVATLLEFADVLEGLGGVQAQIGDAFTQVAVQIAEPFMTLDEVAPVLSLLNTSPSGGAE